jgi:hypothetical protein
LYSEHRVGVEVFSGFRAIVVAQELQLSRISIVFIAVLGVFT